MSYVVSCKGQGRCDCCPGYDHPDLCDDPGLRRLKAVCVGFDTHLDGAAFPYPYSCLYYGSHGCAMACLDRGTRLPIPLLLAFLTTEEQVLPWWDDEAHAGCLVARLAPEVSEQLRGPNAVGYDIALVAMPTYPLICLRARFWTQTAGSLVLEAVFDVAAKDHRRTLVHLTAQESFHIHLHRDDTFAYVYSKRCPLQPTHQDAIEAVLAEAQRRLTALPEAVRNFQRARHIYRTLARP
jgi:hypothetical protein